MSRKFKGTSVPLTAPERLLPTESSGIDLREARSMNRPTRDFGDDRGPRRDFGDDRGPRRDFGDDRGPRRDFGDDRGPRRDFGGEDRFPRRFDRDSDDMPRRSFSRGTEEGGQNAAGDSDDDWRAGPSRTTTAPRRFGGDDSERRAPAPRREETAADMEDDWRAGAGSTARSSAFGDRRGPRREDEDGAPRRFGSRREEEDDGPVRRFSSRKVEESRADDDDWRRPSREETAAPARERLDRTRSAKPATKADDEDDWRAVKPVVRRTSPTAETPVRKERKPVEEKKVVEEEKWSSDEEEEAVVVQEVKPDMDKINKFASKVGQYIEVSQSEDVVKKIDSVTKKIPVNFGQVELASFEPARAVIGLVLKADSLVSDKEIHRLVGLVAPIMLCLEEQYTSFGGSVQDYQMQIVEEVQILVAALGCPRLSPKQALVEMIWLALYENGVVCEDVFSKWLESDQFASPSKSITMFQTEAFRAWLYEFELPGVQATVRKTQEAEDKDEWSSDDDSDIEALVPKRISAATVRAGNIAPIRR
jgi:hypothetical protein